MSNAKPQGADNGPYLHNQIKEFAGKNQNLLEMLYSRWQDEKEHEDINEYGARLAKEFPPGWQLLSTHKRPFAFNIQVGELAFKLSVTSRSISWTGLPTKIGSTKKG
jgi:hypothetical protein